MNGPEFLEKVKLEFDKLNSNKQVQNESTEHYFEKCASTLPSGRQATKSRPNLSDISNIMAKERRNMSKNN